MVIDLRGITLKQRVRRTQTYTVTEGCLPVQKDGQAETPEKDEAGQAPAGTWLLKQERHLLEKEGDDLEDVK